MKNILGKIVVFGKLELVDKKTKDPNEFHFFDAINGLSGRLDAKSKKQPKTRSDFKRKLPVLGYLQEKLVWLRFKKQFCY